LRKLCINLSIALKTGLSDLETLPALDLIEIAKEVAEAYGRK